MWLPWPKATVLIVSGPADDPDRMHLFVILTKGLGESDEVLLVSMQSLYSNRTHDTSCVLVAGDHPFVRRPTFMRYDQCRKIPQSKLLEAVKKGTMEARDPISDEIYDRICNGLRASLHTPPWAKEWLNWHDNLAD